MNLTNEDIQIVSDWEELKAQGSDHYKTGGVEPIDLYRNLGLFRGWAICEICQHALRNRIEGRESFQSDMDKIIDYAQKLKATVQD